MIHCSLLAVALWLALFGEFGFGLAVVCVWLRISGVAIS